MNREIYVSDFIKNNIKSQNFPGYPACNLMYYIVLTTLKRSNNVILETGSFHGISTAVIAQAVEDLSLRIGLYNSAFRNISTTEELPFKSNIYSIEIDKSAYDKAVENMKLSGLNTHVTFIHGDSKIEIPKLLETITQLDFAFLDSDHSFNGIYTEFNLIKNIVKASNGYMYFDNTEAGGVNDALVRIKAENDCNLIRFPLCSYSPPGQALLHF